jgi:hypothetical protein
MVASPSATTTVSDKVAATAKGLDICCVIAPVAVNADIIPRLYSSVDALYAQHGYSEGLEYCSLHFDGSGKSVYFVGVPITTLGAISRTNASGNTGTSVASIAAGVNGTLTEHGGKLSVNQGGTVGTDQIVLDLSLDDGFSKKPIRFGTGTTYTDPYAGFTITLGAGTLIANDVILTWQASGPRASTTDIGLARVALAEGQQAFRTIVLCGDLQDSTEAQAVLDQVNAYETSNKRFTLLRASVKDRLPQAAMSKTIARMTGTPTLSFAEVGASGDTITRSAGSWISDGFAVGDAITVTGSVSNNVSSAIIASLTATVLTLGAAAGDDLVNEAAAAGCSVIGSPSLTFAEVGASGDTITRSRGSWLTDGFRAGDIITVTGTTGNNLTAGVVASATATVLTLAGGGGDDLAAEVIGSRLVTLTAGQTKAAWAAATVAAFQSIDSAPRISLAFGRARKASPFTGWNFRRSANWAASIREYQHDIHIAPWRKNDGTLGWSLQGLDKKLAEWDDRVDGGIGCANRFTTFTTWGNGPVGTFIALSLTRAEDSSLRVMTHNMNVVNLVQALTQTATEDALIGVTLDLNDDGTATEADLAAIATRVNASYELDVTVNKQNEGKRASSCRWIPNTTDILNIPEATVTGVTLLQLGGTVLRVNTSVAIQSGGQ